MLDFLPLTLLHQDVSIEAHEREGQVHGVTTMHFCNESTSTGVDYAAFHYRGTTLRVQVAGCDLLEEMDESRWKWAAADAALSVHTTAKSAEESASAALKRGDPCDPVTLEGMQTWRAAQYDVLALVPPSLGRLKKLVLRVHFCSRVARTAPGTVRFVGDGHVLLRSAPGQARVWLPCVDELTTTPSWRIACGGGSGAERRQVLAGPPNNAAATASDLVVLLGVAELEPASQRGVPPLVLDAYKGNQVLVVGVDSTASLPAHVKTVVSVCLENAIRLFELKDAPFVKLVFAEGVSANGIATHVGCGVILLPLSLLQPCDDGDSSPYFAGACNALRVPALFYELAKAVFMLFLGKNGKGCFFRPQSYADVWMVTGFAGGLAWHHMLVAFGIVNTCVWLERFAAATRAELSALKAEGLGDVVLSRSGAEGSVYLCGLAERKSVLVMLQLCARLVRKTDAERLDASRWLPGISMLVKSLVNVHLGSAVSQELSELAADGRHGRGSRTPELRASYSTFYAPPFLSTKSMLDFLSVSQDVDLKSFKRYWVESGGILKVSVCAEYDSAAMVVRVGVQADSCAGAPGAVESVRVAAVLHDDATPPAQLSSKTQAAAATVLATHCVDVDTASQASSCGVSEILTSRMGGTAGTSPVPLNLYDLGGTCRNQERTLCQSDLLLYVRADPYQELLLVDVTLLQKPYKYCLQYHVDMSAVGRLQALTGLGQCVERSGRESTEIVPASLLRTILADADEHFGVKQQALYILRELGAEADADADLSLDTSWCDDTASSSAAGGASDVVSRWTLGVSSFALLCAGVASAVSLQSEAEPGSTLLEWLSVPWPQVHTFTKYLVHFYRSSLRSLDGSIYVLHVVLETLRSLTLSALDGARCEGQNEAAAGKRSGGATNTAAPMATATVVDLLRAVWCFFGATESGGDAVDPSNDVGLPNLVPYLRTEEERACAVAILSAVTECYHAVYARYWDECGRGNRPQRIRLATADDFFCTTEGLLATAGAGGHRRKQRRMNVGESDACGGGHGGGKRQPVRHLVLGRHPLDVVDAWGARQPLLTQELLRFAFCAKSVANTLPTAFFSFVSSDAAAAADGENTSDEVHVSSAAFAARFELLLFSGLRRGGDGGHAKAPRVAAASVTELIDAMRNEHVVYDRDHCMRHSLPHARFSMAAALWGALPVLPGAAGRSQRPRTLPSSFLASSFSNAKPAMMLRILMHKQGDERLFSELLRYYAASWSRHALRAQKDAASQVVVARACTAADICAQVAQICAARAKETRAASKSQKAGSSAAETKFRMAPEARCKRLLGFFCASAEESPELPPTLGLHQRITSPMPAEGGGQAPRTTATEQADDPRQPQQGAALPSTLSLCVGKKAAWAQVARILRERLRIREALPFFHVRMGPKEARLKRADYLVRLHSSGVHDVFSALSREAADPTLPEPAADTELAHHGGFCFWFLKQAVPSSAYSDARDTSPVAVSNAGIEGLLGTPSGHGVGGSEPTTAISVGGVHWWLDGTASEVKPALVLSYSATKTVHPCRPVGKIAWARGTPTANTVAVSRCKRLCLSAHSLTGRGAEVPPGYPVDMLPTTLAALLCKLAPTYRAFYTSCTTVKLQQQPSGSLVTVDLLTSREASGPRVAVPPDMGEKLVASLSREATSALASDDVAVLLRRSQAAAASLDSVCLVFGVHHGDQCGELPLPEGWTACVVGKLLAPVRCAADVDVGWSLTRRLVLCTLEGSGGGVSIEVCMELACNASADALHALLPAHSKAALGRGVVTLPPSFKVSPSAVASMKCPVGSLWASSDGVLNFVAGVGDSVRGTLVALPTAARHVSSSAWHPGAELPSLVTAATQHSDFVNVSLKLA